MKKFLLKILFLSFPGFFILIGINYFGDAANLFNANYVKQMANIILSGKYVTNISNYDERLFQRELINNFHFKPDVIILGSSRSLLINKKTLNEKHLFNNSVSGASIEDIIAVYQMYKSKNKLPKKIIFGIDPWIFNENNDQKRWKSISLEYNQFFANDNNVINNYFKYLELISVSYFQASLKNIPKLIFKKNKPHPSFQKFNKTETRLIDGSLVYSMAIRDASELEIDKQVDLFLSENIYSLGNFKSLSTDLIILFQLLIDDIKKNEIEIVFFLAPYHPKVYKEIKRNYPSVIKSEEFILDYAEKNDIVVFGSYSPEKLNLDKSFFYDGMHPKEEVIKKIFIKQENISK